MHLCILLQVRLNGISSFLIAYAMYFSLGHYVLVLVTNNSTCLRLAVLIFCTNNVTVYWIIRFMAQIFKNFLLYLKCGNFIHSALLCQIFGRQRWTCFPYMSNMVKVLDHHFHLPIPWRQLHVFILSCLISDNLFYNLLCYLLNYRRLFF